VDFTLQTIKTKKYSSGYIYTNNSMNGPSLRSLYEHDSRLQSDRILRAIEAFAESERPRVRSSAEGETITRCTVFVEDEKRQRLAHPTYAESVQVPF
jgi:hypothetical protein